MFFTKAPKLKPLLSFSRGSKWAKIRNIFLIQSLSSSSSLQMSVLLLGNYLTLEIQLKSPKNKTRRGLPQIGGITTAAWHATCWNYFCFYIEEIGPESGSPGSTLSIVSCCSLFYSLLIRRAVGHPGSNLNCTTSSMCNLAESSLYLSKPWFLAQHHASLICSCSLGFPLESEAIST